LKLTLTLAGPLEALVEAVKEERGISAQEAIRLLLGDLLPKQRKRNLQIPQNPETSPDSPESRGSTPPEVPPSSPSLHSPSAPPSLPPPKALSAKAAKPRVPDGFEEFWAAYPRKVSRGAAVKAWEKLRPPLEQVLASIAAWKDSREWADKQFIPHPATWIRAQRWTDEAPLADLLPFGSPPPKSVDPWFYAVLEKYPEPCEAREAAFSRIGRPLEPHEELAIANYRKAAR
jgi:hypothetical protein